jgi:hypothetical protein
MEPSVLLRRNAMSYGEHYPTLRRPSNFGKEGDTFLTNIGIHFTATKPPIQVDQNPRLHRCSKLKTRSIYNEDFWV